MAYVIEKKKGLKKLNFLPIEQKLTDGVIIIDIIQEEHCEPLQEMLNDVIADGQTYPQEGELDLEQFKAYYCSHDVFVATKQLNGEVVGSFYVKPNYPGRSSHICNGGFLVRKDFRGKGLGRLLASAYLRIAPALGYEASMFNLVYVSNEASLRLWRALGFKETGRIPRAGNLKGLGYVDAINFYYDFLDSTPHLEAAKLYQKREIEEKKKIQNNNNNNTKSITQEGNGKPITNNNYKKFSPYFVACNVVGVLALTAFLGTRMKRS